MRTPLRPPCNAAACPLSRPSSVVVGSEKCRDSTLIGRRRQRTARSHARAQHRNGDRRGTAKEDGTRETIVTPVLRLEPAGRMQNRQRIYRDPLVHRLLAGTPIHVVAAEHRFRRNFEVAIVGRPATRREFLLFEQIERFGSSSSTPTRIFQRIDGFSAVGEALDDLFAAHRAILLPCGAMRQPMPNLSPAGAPCYPAVGGIHMSDAAAAKRVRHFRQILLWPLQLMPLREGNQIQRHWEVLHSAGADNPWREVVDEFGGAPGQYQERHYNELVTFLPYVQRFLYGDGYVATRTATAIRRCAYSAATTSRAVRVESHPDAAPITADDRARRPVLLLRHRRDAAERRGLRRTTCRSTSCRTCCTGSAARIRPAGTRTARAFTRCIASSGSRADGTVLARSRIRANARNS